MKTGFQKPVALLPVYKTKQKIPIHFTKRSACLSFSQHIKRIIYFTINPFFSSKIRIFAFYFPEMDTTNLRTNIQRISRNMPETDIPLIMGCAECRELQKGEILVKEGDICRSFFLVENGYLRTWYNKDGETINLNFTFEGEYTTNLKSLNTREPSAYTIEAGEDTVIWIFNLNTIVQELKSPPEMILFIRRLSVHILLAAEEHSNLFKLFTPTERYLYIEKNKPDLLQRISLTQIASYLGVTRETISRIRAKRS